MSFNKLSEAEESIAKKIVDAAYAVHKALGHFNVPLIKNGINRIVL